MQRRTILIITAVVVVVAAIIIAAASQLTPNSPAFTTAVDFVNAAASGDDAAAQSLLDDTMRAYVADHCPQGSAAACVQSFTPPDWGAIVSAVFRRAAPAGAAWDVEVIAHYQQDKGASGVCSLIHVAQDAAGAWKVAGWAGFVHCGEPQSRDMATNPDTPNRAP
jgi:hypothetical protein